MNIEFIKSNEKRDIIAKLNEQFGIEDLPYLLLWTGKEKIRAFSGSLSKDEIMDLGKIARVELLGTYFIKDEGLYRLSLDATTILKSKITKNIIDVTDQQLAQWIRGNDLDLAAPQGVVIIRHGVDLIGCGKSNGKTVFNYIPKDRRLKK